MVRPDGAMTVPSAIIVQGIVAGTVTLMLDVSTESVTSLAAQAGDAVLKAMAAVAMRQVRVRAMIPTFLVFPIFLLPREKWRYIERHNVFHFDEGR